MMVMAAWLKMEYKTAVKGLNIFNIARLEKLALGIYSLETKMVDVL